MPPDAARSDKGELTPAPGGRGFERERRSPEEVSIRLLTAPDAGMLAQRDRRPPFQSLAPARLCGYMESRGYADCEHLDLSLALARWLDREGRDIDLTSLSDRASVDAYLGSSGGNEIQEIIDILLDAAAIAPAQLFGISLVRQHVDHFDGQVALALDLCLLQALKRRYPDCVTVLGGLIHVSFLAKRAFLIELLERCSALDFVVEGPGERALHSIAEAAFGGRPLDAYRQAHEQHGRQFYLFPGGPPLVEDGAGLKRSKPKPELRIHDRFALSELQCLPAALPAFTNAEDYRLSGHALAATYGFSQQVREDVGAFLDRSICPLTLQFVTGCSGVCAFCCSAKVSAVALPVSDVVRSVLALRDRYDSSHFIFMNNAVNWSYDYALELAKALIAARADIRWTDSLNLSSIDERLVEQLRLSGFIRADVGVEAASSRLRKMMRKPLTGAQVIDRLRLLHENGIWCDINVIVGIPHEREEDLEETRQFLRDAAEYFNNCALDPFFLIDIAPIGQEPQRYGLIIRPGEETTDLGLRLPYDEIGGLRFEERLSQAGKASSRLRREVAGFGNHCYCDPYNTIHYHLLFFLYDIFGHDHKETIREIHRNALGQRTST